MRYCDLERVQEVRAGVWRLRCRRAGCGRETESEREPRWVRLVCRAGGEGEEKAVAVGGPGTELKGLLGRLGIRASKTCKCNQRAQEMDERGPAWCRENIATIVGWLEEEAGRQGYRLFNRRAARIIVRLAVRRAERREREANEQG